MASDFFRTRAFLLFNAGTDSPILFLSCVIVRLMQSEQKPETLARIIWLAIAMSVVIYGIVAFFATPRNEPRTFGELFRDPLVLILHAAGFAMFVTAFVLPSVLLNVARAKGNSKPQPTREVRITPEAMKTLVIRFALLEAPAILGLVAAFLSIDWRLVLPLGILSLAGLLVSYPGEDMLRRLADPAQ